MSNGWIVWYRLFSARLLEKTRNPMATVRNNKLYLRVTDDKYRHIIAMAYSAVQLAKICGVETSTVMKSVNRKNGPGLYELVIFDEELEPQLMIPQPKVPKDLQYKSLRDGMSEIELALHYEYKRQKDRERYWKHAESQRRKKLAAHHRRKEKRKCLQQQGLAGQS